MIGVVIGGITQSAYFVLIGLGVVLIYRQSGVLNFSLGPVATLAAYVAYSLLRLDAPYWLAAAAGIAVAMVVSAVIERIVVRPLLKHGDITVAIATFGPGLLIIGLLGFIYGNAFLPLPSPLPDEQLILGPVRIGLNQLLAIVLAIVSLVGIYVLLMRTRFGLSLRAASEGPVTASMLGINVNRVQTIVWAVSGGLAGVAALLIAGHYYLDPTFLTTFKIGSFAAIVLGGMESVAGLAVGALMFGLVTAEFSYFATARLLQTLNFVAIVVILTVFPYGLFGRRLERVAEPIIKAGGFRGFERLRARFRRPAVEPSRRGSTAYLLVVGLIGAAILAAFPGIASDLDLFIVASIAYTFVAAAGLNFVSGYLGQGSLGQAGFIAIGAYVYVLLRVQADVPELLAAISGVAFAGGIGLVFGMPAMRLQGVYLALITLSFTLAVPELVAFPEEITGGVIGVSVPRSEFATAGFPTLVSQYWVIGAVGFAVLALAHRAGSGRLGRRWRAIRDSETGAASIGINVARTKLYNFAMSGALGGLSGVLGAILIGYIAPDSYSLWLSAFLLAAIIIGGRGSTLGSLLGSAFVIGIPFVTSTTAVWSQVFFGVAILAALLLFPGGLASLIRAIWALFGRGAARGAA